MVQEFGSNLLIKFWLTDKTQNYLLILAHIIQEWIIDGDEKVAQRLGIIQS
jgi:hypothetical protein